AVCPDPSHDRGQVDHDVGTFPPKQGSYRLAVTQIALRAARDDDFRRCCSPKLFADHPTKKACSTPHENAAIPKYAHCCLSNSFGKTVTPIPRLSGTRPHTHGDPVLYGLPTSNLRDARRVGPRQETGHQRGRQGSSC